MPRFFGDIQCAPYGGLWKMHGRVDCGFSFSVSHQQDSGCFCSVKVLFNRVWQQGERGQDHPSASDVHHTISGHTQNLLWCIGASNNIAELSGTQKKFCLHASSQLQSAACLSSQF